MNSICIKPQETQSPYLSVAHFEAEAAYQSGKQDQYSQLVKDIEELAFPDVADEFLANYTQPDTTWSDLYKALEMWAADQCLITACPACASYPGNGLYQGDCPVCGGRGYQLTGGMA